MPKRFRVGVSCCLLTLAVAACGGVAGPARTSQAPSPASTAAFTLTSPDFADGGEIPEQFGCSGSDVSPELDWDGAPAGTQELVLIAVDSDANGFLHWLLTNIPPQSSGRLAEGAGDAQRFPDGQAVNDFGHRGYGGPCPPKRHIYDFTLYALSQPLEGNTPLTKLAVQAAMADRLLAETHLRGTYKQGG
jgi:Raf kinase inhibitor-like YbhB/YbcL family protein